MHKTNELLECRSWQ